MNPNDPTGPSLASPRILVVEDEPALRSVLHDHLVASGFRVLLAANADEGFRRATTERPDLVLLDWMLPGETGDLLCRRLRARGVTCPIVMLTSRSDADFQVEVLESGADDYWVKPVPFKVMVARIHALLRRQGREKRGAARLTFGDLCIDLPRRTVTRAGERLELGPKEFGILEALMLAAGAPVSREQLLTSVWHYDYAPESRTVDNYVMMLRRKLESDPLHPRLVLTVRGEGYRLNVEALHDEGDEPLQSP